MEIDFYEEIFCTKIEYIKKFHAFLIQKYSLNEIPYAVVGKPFLKIGEFEIDGEMVLYHFH